MGFEGLVVRREPFAVYHTQIADPAFQAALDFLYE